MMCYSVIRQLRVRAALLERGKVDGDEEAEEDGADDAVRAEHHHSA